MRAGGLILARTAYWSRTELKNIAPAVTEVLGPEVDRLATLHTNARTVAALHAISSRPPTDLPAISPSPYAAEGGSRQTESVSKEGRAMSWSPCSFPVKAGAPVLVGLSDA